LYGRRRCYVIFLNVRAPTEDKNDGKKERFYEEVDCVFHHLPKNHMKIFLGDFNAKSREKTYFQISDREDDFTRN
jgi:endonuclease/exonuclease/phosphatase family metal-dependent hydrolase